MKNNNQSTIKQFEDPLGVNAIAGASNSKELVDAFDKAKQSFDKWFQDLALQELHNLAEEIESGSGKENSVKQYIAKYHEIEFSNGVFNGKTVQGSVCVLYQNQAIKLREALIDEHQAKSVSETMIIDLMINAYFRGLHISSIYSHLAVDASDTAKTSQLKVNTLKELGKQIEFANKQFASLLTMIREMKRPPINIKVNSKQAFVGQNQQFNKNS